MDRGVVLCLHCLLGFPLLRLASVLVIGTLAASLKPLVKVLFRRGGPDGRSRKTQVPNLRLELVCIALEFEVKYSSIKGMLVQLKD